MTPSGRRGPRGAQLVFTRGRTSRDRLEIDWDYPVVPEAPQPLGFEDARDRVRGDDRRPLLVLRECRMCVGADSALLSRSLNNEKTAVLTRFFHCVKLAPDVIAKNHAFRDLFAGEHPPHLFLLSADGTLQLQMTGQQRQSDLWKAMFRVLRHDHERRPEHVVAELLGLLDEFDRLDAREDELRDQIDRAIIASGPASTRVAKLTGKLAEIHEAHKAALARERRLANLVPRQPKKKSP